MTLICTRGLPASGKTTWAVEQVKAAEPGTVVRLNRDDLRWSMHTHPHLKYETEQQISLVQHGGAEALLAAGVTVIVDDTNLRSRNLRNLAEIAWRNDVDFAVQDFTDVSLAECITRDLGREGTPGFVGEDVIRRIHGKYLAGRALPLPVPDRPADLVGESYVPPLDKPLAVMVDIDGTVALHGDRDPYDTSRYHEDTPNAAVIEMVRAAYRSGFAVLFCSGRDDDFREVTAAWIKDHVQVPPEALLMRPSGDRRSDHVVKLELFDQYIRHAYHVMCVFDDRDRVVKAWRGIGLTVMQVAEGKF